MAPGDGMSLNEREICQLMGNNRMTDVPHHVNDAGQPELIAAADRVLIGRNRQFKTRLNFNMVFIYLCFSALTAEWTLYLLDMPENFKTM
ncbi:hypothetical protein SynBIOSE41_03107 [Synechococcus sp. BIOS-E4-1]|uniref:hypothetical protein n=1 Tax=Synechococcus sp. BIOS-E4-1 TaxID=1400864 RepID=UPI001648B9CF|nr:hypothetical protein [Synechococcus sp. BIOS-E4-1]QNI55589.1 hypothetical protein SynBIOSE41_03107 [Synechococcus sp. BIOS-E4-1]